MGELILFSIRLMEPESLALLFCDTKNPSRLELQRLFCNNNSDDGKTVHTSQKKETQQQQQEKRLNGTFCLSHPKKKLAINEEQKKWQDVVVGLM